MKKIQLFLTSIFLVFCSTLVFAEEMGVEGDDWEILDLEVEKLLNLGSGILATVLCIITLFAYKTTKRNRLLYVSIAFALFAVKGFLTSTELFFEEVAWIDPVASMLNFGILLAFFAGLLKK